MRPRADLSARVGLCVCVVAALVLAAGMSIPTASFSQDKSQQEERKKQPTLAQFV